MTGYAYFIMDLLLSTVEIQFFFRYYIRVYGSPSKNPGSLRLFSSIWMLLFTCMARLLLDPMRPASHPLFTLLASLILLPFFRCRRDKKILFTAFLLGLSYAWILLLDLLLSPLPQKNIPIPLLFFFFHAGFWLLLELMKHTGSREYQEVPKSMWFLLILIAGVLLCAMGLFHWKLLSSETGSRIGTEPYALGVFLFVLISLFIFFDRFSFLLKRVKEQSLLEQQLELQNEYYRQLQSCQEQIASLHHDMKNHIQTALSLTQAASDQHQLLNYLNSVYGRLEDITATVQTGNPGLDSILNLKLSQLCYEKIPCTTRIHIPPGLGLSFEEGVTILGNLLDNALESSRKLPPEDRWVRLMLSYSNSALYIKIDNARCGGSTGKTDIPPSDKKNPLFHGYGLKNVQKFVEKRGSMEIIDTAPDVFSVHILLYGLLSEKGTS